MEKIMKSIKKLSIITMVTLAVAAQPAYGMNWNGMSLIGSWCATTVQNHWKALTAATCVVGIGFLCWWNRDSIKKRADEFFIKFFMNREHNNFGDKQMNYMPKNTPKNKETIVHKEQSSNHYIDFEQLLKRLGRLKELGEIHMEVTKNDNSVTTYSQAEDKIYGASLNNLTSIIESTTNTLLATIFNVKSVEFTKVTKK